MTKQELIETLDFSRGAIDDLLEGAPDETLLAPGLNGEWSVKDLLAHLTAWEAEMVRALAQLRQGGRPAYFDIGAEQVDALNAQFYRENKDRPLERILADFEGVRAQLIRQVERYSSAELNAPPKGVGGTTTILEYIRSETLKHEQDHLPDLRAWRENVERGA